MDKNTRQPPYSIEAEQSVLGGLMIDNRCWIDLSDTLTEADFYRADHQLIWRAMAHLLNVGKPCDLTTMVAHLSGSGELQEAGGVAYLGTLANDTPSAANVLAYADVIRERSILRALVGAGGDIAEMGFRPDGREPAELLDLAQAAVMKIGERTQATGPEDLGTLSEIFFQSLEARRETGQVGTSTGFRDLDRQLGGLQPGNLVIIAGRPSMGKTALALNIADWVARDEHVLVFSMEMGRDEITSRIVGFNGRVAGHLLRQPRLMTQDDQDAVIRAVMENKTRQMTIDDRGGLTALQVRAKSRKVARKSKLGLIVIDYIQLMQGVGGNRNEEVNEITRSLKSLAKELECPVIALSQLNRGCEARENKRPRLADLRESGGIEQDADIVIGVYRDEIYYPDSPHKGLAEAIILKQRNGAIGTVVLTWEGPLFLFGNYDGPPLSNEREPGKQSGGFGRGRGGF